MKIDPMILLFQKYILVKVMLVCVYTTMLLYSITRFMFSAYNVCIEYTMYSLVHLYNTYKIIIFFSQFKLLLYDKISILSYKIIVEKIKF